MQRVKGKKRYKKFYAWRFLASTATFYFEEKAKAHANSAGFCL